MAEMEMWVSMTPLREFPSCSADILQRAERNDFPWYRLFDLDPPQLGDTMCNPKLETTIHRFVHQLPKSHKPSSKPSLPRSAPSRQGSLNLAPINRVPCTPCPLPGCFGKSRWTPQTSPHAQRALNVPRKELSEVIELLQQVTQNDLSQTRALLSLMVAILSDTPKSSE
ncbi:hypothetical protein PSTT_15187 [Puccinia striiformis]|uniref:Uncharacterized protein n=2 Tax=Puccinia striiformis TaxID=27350 RepID=A0A0L0V0W8_9BASI|nr:hypothetical protein PSTG_13709 [Puccinia striiformis f. sp. tritici PST-78]POV97257.1 hypothetical protein PSTT_15187 [Puccinia striiformis]